MSEEVTPEQARERWHAAALCLGFNECAKIVKTLGEKVYFRLMREEAEKHFMSLGGQKIFQQEPPVLTLYLDTGAPFIEFREQDIELMRECVAKAEARTEAAEHLVDRQHAEQVERELTVLREQYDRHVARHIDEKRVLRHERDEARAALVEADRQTAASVRTMLAQHQNEVARLQRVAALGAELLVALDKDGHADTTAFRAALDAVEKEEGNTG